MKTPKQLAPPGSPSYVSASWICGAYSIGYTTVERAWLRGDLKIAATYEPSGTRFERPLFSADEAHRWARDRYLTAIADDGDAQTKRPSDD